MPIATLPDEMLACIFEECVNGDTGEPGGEGLGFSPRILALVSRKWYRVALGTASLWRTILVTDGSLMYWRIIWTWGSPYMESPKNARTHSAMQVCTSVAELESALRRTGGTTLDITIAFFGISHGSLSGVDFSSQLYEMLLTDRVTPRITHLALEQGSINLAPELVFESNVHRLSSLVYLACRQPHSQPQTWHRKSVLQQILENSKTLKSMFLISSSPVNSIIEDCLQAHTWQNASYSSTILNLQQLRVGSGRMLEKMFSDTMPIPELIIEHSTRIERAEEQELWESGPIPWPTASTLKMNFSCLTHMHLVVQNISYLSPHTFPVLEYLRVSDTSERDDTVDNAPDFVMDFPRLRSLRIRARQFALVNRFNLPQLESFHMRSRHSVKYKAEADFLQLFSLSAVSSEPLAEGSESVTMKPTELWFQNIRTLHINANISERILIRALGVLPLLSVLQLVPGKKMTEVLVKKLTVQKPKHPPEKNNVFCPALEVIELDLVSFMVPDWGNTLRTVGTTMVEGLPNALIKCVASRRNAGKPLRRCTVVSREGKQEYAES